MKHYKGLLLIGGVVLLAGLVVAAVLHKTPNIAIQVSPTTATLTLDGAKKIKAGQVYIAPGSHKLSASADGFTSNTVSFTSVKGQLKTVSILLNPSSATGQNLINNSPSEQAARQTIGGQAFQDTTQERLKKNPIIADLPYTELNFRIDYVQSKANPNDETAIAVQITLYADAGKQQALDWISKQGFDPSKLEIIYVDQTQETWSADDS